VERVLSIVGREGLRCLVAYRALAQVASQARRGDRVAVDGSVPVTTRILDRLEPLAA